MVISETKDLSMLKKMYEVGQLHMKRCLTEDSPEFDLEKASEIQLELLKVRFRIEELEGKDEQTEQDSSPR